MSSEAIETRVLRNLEQKQKTCYICSKRGHTKYECRQSPSISNHIQKRHDPDIEDVVLIMEGLPLSDDIDLNQFMKSLLNSLKLSFIKPDQYKMKRPWTHFCRKNDVKITFSNSETKKLFFDAVNSQKKLNFTKDIFCYYGQYNDKGLKFTYKKKEYKLGFREDLPHDLDKMYTKALEIKEQYGVDCVMIGNQGKIVAHKRMFSYIWCKNEEDLEKLRKNLEREHKDRVLRKRKLLSIGPVNGGRSQRTI